MTHCFSYERKRSTIQIVYIHVSIQQPDTSFILLHRPKTMTIKCPLSCHIRDSQAPTQEKPAARANPHSPPRQTSHTEPQPHSTQELNTPLTQNRHHYELLAPKHPPISYENIAKKRTHKLQRNFCQAPALLKHARLGRSRLLGVASEALGIRFLCPVARDH